MKLKIQRVLKLDKISSNDDSNSRNKTRDGLPETPKLGDETFE